MERQLGAVDFDIDTEAGWVKFALPTPQTLDFLKVADVLDSANYELHSIEVSLSGTVERGPGGNVFLVRGTGQRIPLDADSPVVSSVPTRATVTGWRTASPRLLLIEPGTRPGGRKPGSRSGDATPADNQGA